MQRRGFLKLGLAGAAALLYSRLEAAAAGEPLDEWDARPLGVGRVAGESIYRYAEPAFKSQRLGILHRDRLVEIFGEIQAPTKTSRNPMWYRLPNGYVHSAYIQRVDAARPNPGPLPPLPETGLLGEICVPFTDSFRPLGRSQRMRLYRLRFESVHWITGGETGPDGKPWAQLTDDLLKIKLLIPAAHIRPIHPGGLAPISPELPEDEKAIHISLQEQRLQAFEGSQMVFETPVSSGIASRRPSPNGIPTDTPPGRFRVQLKMPSRHMGDGEITADPLAYELPGVPWVCVFHKDGIALHGTYWHNNFGSRMSHGCVNLPNPAARWLYRWITPAIAPQDWYIQGIGTQVIIEE